MRGEPSQVVSTPQASRSGNPAAAPGTSISSDSGTTSDAALDRLANEARNRRRMTRRQGDLLRAAVDARLREVAPSAEAAALAGERRQVLADAVKWLPEPDRRVIACRYFLELAETAQVLGWRLGTGKSRTARGFARLRGLLDEQRAGQLQTQAEGLGG
jgi:DNA-directed RNA polymerase specialized sigma24 family protein